MTGRRIFAAGMLLGLFLAVTLKGQTQRAPATLDDLLTEMRGLRADIARTSSASVRVQVFTARLTLQEQRIADLTRQATAVQGRLEEQSKKRRDLEETAKNIEKGTMDPTIPAGQQQDLRQMLPHLRAEVEQAQAAEQQTRTELSSLASAIATEQGLWMTFSNQLNDLERAATR